MADLTPAEELRAAAARLREHAKSASTWPWTSAPSWAGENAVLNAGGHPVAVCGEEIPGSDYPASADAAWIALAHPGLAEPLARLLDDAVDRLGYFAGLGEKALSLAEYELAAARALLGGGRD